MKFIHASDFHLCRSFNSSSLPSNIARELRQRLFRVFFDIIKTCMDEQVDVLLLSGDILEGEYATISEVKRIADAFATIKKTKVFISCGNHDPLTETSLYKIIEFPENVHIFSSEFSYVELDEHNARVYGFSWDKKYYDECPFEFEELDKSRINILNLHCDVFNKSRYMPINADDISCVGYDYVALGHIHKSQQVKSNIFYAGSCEALDFNEDGRHGYFYGEISPEKKLTVKFKGLHSGVLFESVKVMLSADMGYEDIKQAVFSSCKIDIKKNIFKIIFKGTVNNQVDLSRLMVEMSEEFYHVKFKDNTTPDYDIIKLCKENQDNIIGRYIDSLRTEIQSDPIAFGALKVGLNALLEQEN